MKSFVKNTPTPDSSVDVASTTTVCDAGSTISPSASPTGPDTPLQQAAPAAVVVRPSLAVGSVSARFEGEMGVSDLNKPVLTVVHGVGPRSAVFTPGTVVIGESVIFNASARPMDPTGKVRVVFGRVVKDYVERLKFGGDIRPRIFKTEAEVFALGGTTSWINGNPPTFDPRVATIALVRSPDGCIDESAFGIIDGEQTYSPALISFSKTSYGAARTLLTDLQLRLKFDPTGAYYDLFWVTEKKGDNFVKCAKLERVREEVPSEGVKRRLEELCGRAKPTDFENLED